MSKSSFMPAPACTHCNGCGILIGAYDPNSGKKEIRQCRECDGIGIKINRCHPEYRALRAEIQINL